MRNKRLKKAVRERMSETGENYCQARTKILADIEEQRRGVAAEDQAAERTPQLLEGWWR